jgi:hypothetical protein
MEDELMQTDANFEDPAGRAPLMGNRGTLQ